MRATGSAAVLAVLLTGCATGDAPRFKRLECPSQPLQSDIVATQTVHHSTKYPSRLLLPFVP